nr:hypothetical protein [Streptomyces anulatus]
MLTGEKNIGHRPRPWKPGWVLLHPGQQIDRPALRLPLVARTIRDGELVTGAVVGIARITDCHQDTEVVEMMLADQDSWDRYAAAQWLSMRRWLDENPDDELVPEVREELTTEPAHYARYGREYLSWGVFALMKR